MIIDGHIHVWPDRIAKRALGTPTEGLQRVGDGTVRDAEITLSRAGIDRGICLAVADAPERLEAANEFVATLDPDHFIGFGTIHPGRSVEDNLRSLRAGGLRGIKVHPLFQGFALDDPRLWSILEAIAGEFVAVFHVGPESAGGENTMATPKMIRDIARNFPRLDLVAAHFGGYHALDEALEFVHGTDVCLDTSWPPGLAELGSARVREIVRRHGPERVVFASDWPMASPATELEAIIGLGLSTADTEAILGANFERLLDGKGSQS